MLLFELDELLLQGSESTLGAPAGDARDLGRTRPWNPSSSCLGKLIKTHPLFRMSNMYILDETDSSRAEKGITSINYVYGRD